MSEFVDDILRTVVDAVGRGDDLFSALDALQAPIYVTDAEGVITHFNRACVGFTGRVPAVGKDRWCVSWKLYSDDGAPLAHDQCPMAVALQTGHPIRGAVAVAERPDGSRVRFTPFPTPLFSSDGALVGAVNVLIDATDDRQIGDLELQAQKCRRLASRVDDRQTAAALNQMAAEFDAKAERLARVN